LVGSFSSFTVRFVPLIAFGYHCLDFLVLRSGFVLVTLFTFASVLGLLRFDVCGLRFILVRHVLDFVAVCSFTRSARCYVADLRVALRLRVGFG